MRRAFTFIMGLVLLYTQSKAQYSQNFETAGVLGTNCLDQTQFIFTNGSDVQVIHGLGSAYTNPPTSAAELRSLTTPFLTISTDTLTVSFYYQLSNKLNGNATRVIEVGLLDRYGVFIALDQISMDKNSDATPQFYNRTFRDLTPGVKRVEFRITGATGAGNSRMIYDDLYVSANPYYGPINNCNSAPLALNDNYFSPILVPVSGNVLTDGPVADSDPNGETITPAIATPPADSLGTITFNSDGTFTFTPAPGFRGGLVQFTYRVTDDGYPMTSRLATVTISYLISTLPVQLTGFSGKLTNSKAELSWSVAGNETASLFVVERSTDGRNFSAAGSVPPTAKSGSESYRFTDAVPVQGKQIYRLRITDRQGKEEYSKTILLQTDASTTPALLLLNNPVVSDLTFLYNSASDSKAFISIYNMAGQRVYTHTHQVRSGVNQLTVDGRWLQGGQVYILEVATQQGTRSTLKLNKR